MRHEVVHWLTGLAAISSPVVVQMVNERLGSPVPAETSAFAGIGVGLFIYAVIGTWLHWKFR